jgi:hypothetical protein
LAFFFYLGWSNMSAIRQGWLFNAMASTLGVTVGDAAVPNGDGPRETKLELSSLDHFRSA